MEYNFFATISRMKYIERWALMRNSRSENLSEHSLDVAMIAHALCVIGNVRHGKNLNADNIGLVHYRRLFKGKDGQAISGSEVDTLLSGYKVILPKKRRYYIETLYSHYVHTHNNEEIDETANVIAKFYPDYKDSYDKIMKQTWGYMFNMMVLPKEMLDSYCTWLFDILGKVVEKVGEGDRSAFEKRYPGRLSELLFNCWLDHQIKAGNISKSDIIEVPLLNLGDEKFMKKLIAFLKAKFFGKKQDKSF